MTEYEELNEYKRGSTYIVEATITDPSNDALVDPTSVTCSFRKPDGSAVAGGDMTKDSIGVYHYDYNTPSDALQGVWIPIVTATTGTRVKISETKFLVF